MVQEFLMKKISVTYLQEHFDTIIDEVIKTNEPITIVDDQGREFVLISVKEWKALQESVKSNKSGLFHEDY